MTDCNEYEARSSPAGTSAVTSDTRISRERAFNQYWQRALFLPLSILAWMVIAIIALWLLDHIPHALVVLVLAVVVTFALAPLVSLLRRWLSRPFAIAGAYLLGIGVVIGLGALLVSVVVGQVVTLVQKLPDYINRLNEFSPQTQVFLGSFGVTIADIRSFNQQILATLQANGNALAAGSLSLINELVSVLVDAALIVMLSIYLTIDGERAVDWLRSKIPLRFRHYSRYVLGVSNAVVGGYVRGTLSMALLTAVLVGLGLQVLGIPYALLLGILAFLMEFVPVVGVLISGVIALLVALPKGLAITMVVLVYFIVVHILEADVIEPRVMGKALGIHPATGIIALLVGTELFGVWGALFGAPLAGLLQAIVLGIWQVQQSNRIAPDELPVRIAEGLEALPKEGRKA